MVLRTFGSQSIWRCSEGLAEDLIYGAGNLVLSIHKAKSHIADRVVLQFHRSVHNIRIERLWVDVTAQVGSKWADFFTTLELCHGLNINNAHHIWLLHYLFLDYVNYDLTFFTDAWNQHKIAMHGGPRRSPADMFGFDMLIHGVRGDPPSDHLTENDELEVYGVDWEALQDDTLRASHAGNNSTSEGWSSAWIGHTGPPEHLNEVQVDPPELGAQEMDLVLALQAMLPAVNYEAAVLMETLVHRWVTGLAVATTMYQNDFC